MATAATASGRKTRKARTAGTVQASTNFISSNDYDNSLDGIRVQRVISLAGVSPSLARIIAPLAFGGAA